MMRDRLAPPQMPEPEAVVAVDQKPSCAFHGAAFAQLSPGATMTGPADPATIGGPGHQVNGPAGQRSSPEALAVATQHRRKRSGETIGAGGSRPHAHRAARSAGAAAAALSQCSIVSILRTI